ncbi:MAG: GAF domain-containing protein [Planctomycetes bacterium]|nr:GAF domain-containing protein [Planctomycetota bacterium]
MNPEPHALVRAVDELFVRGKPPQWDTLLERLLRHFDCVVGTVHLLRADDGMLHLAAQRGLPPPLLDKVNVIPIGKGMAGIAAQRKEPVQVCNLQTDTSGVARPNAKTTKMEGSLAAPMLLRGELRGELRGVLGVAKPVAYDFTAAETQLLMDVGARVASLLA